MSAGTHDNWEKLVRSVLRREHDRQLALVDSCSVSSTSSVSDPRLSLRSSPPSDYDYSESDPGSPRKILRMNFMDLTLDHRQWKEMLPPGKRELLWTSAAPLRYSIHKRSGKNCFLFGATRGCGWATELMKESRFSEVVPFQCPSMLNMQAQITRKMLSPHTLYSVYLVLKENLKDQIHLESIIYESGRQVKEVIFQQSVKRGDGWIEIRLGGFYIDQQHEGFYIDHPEEVKVELHEISMVRTNDIFVEGLEFRPDTPAAYRLFRKGR